MLVDERRQIILQVIENKGFASLTQLAELVGASDSTVRRDLEFLDGIGQIRRTRGGAAYVGESLTSFDVRGTQAREQKEHVADAAAALVQTGETIILDGGTTTLEVARQLAGRTLQVVTNSIPIVNVLVNSPQTELIVIGGFLYPKTGVNLGPIAVEALKSIHARRLFISVGGITATSLFNSNALLVETERQMIESAEEVIVVSDSSKLGHSALAQLCPLETVDRLIIDDGITDEWRKSCERAGIELTVVESLQNWQPRSPEQTSNARSATFWPKRASRGNGQRPKSNPLVVNISARHVHLTDEHVRDPLRQSRTRADEAAATRTAFTRPKSPSPSSVPACG